MEQEEGADAVAVNMAVNRIAEYVHLSRRCDVHPADPDSRLKPKQVSCVGAQVGSSMERPTVMRAIRAGRPHGRAETAAHGFCSSDDEKEPQEKTVRARNGVVADSGVGSEDGVRRRGDRQRLMHPIHQSEPAHVARIGQVTLRARQWADWAAFFRDGMLQEIGAEMQDFQSTSVYHSANL